MYYTETDNEIIFPQISPEKSIGDFIESKLNERILKKYPEWDFPRIDPKVNLAALRRDLHDVEERLNKKLEEGKVKRRQLDNEWKELEKNGAQLRQTFCNFDKMVRDNAAKAERSSAKTQSLILFEANTDNSIKRLENEYNKLFKIKEEMELQIKKHYLYEKFLHTVADAHPTEFANAQEVFYKFATLDEARHTVAGRLTQNITSLEGDKDKMGQQVIDHNTIVVGLHNRITELNTKFTEVKKKSEKWDGIVHNVQTRLRERLLDILTVRKLCWCIYLDMCKRRGKAPRIPQDDFESQFWYIKKQLRMLKKTITFAKRQLDIDASSMVVERPTSPKHGV